MNKTQHENLNNAKENLREFKDNYCDSSCRDCIFRDCNMCRINSFLYGVKRKEYMNDIFKTIKQL